MRKSRKIFLTIFVLLLTLVTLVTSTFAWFTIAQNAQVEQLALSVSQAKELLISLDGVNYSENLTNDQIKNKIGNKLALNSVTSNDLSEFYSSYKMDQESVPNIDYLMVDLWFKTNDEDLNGLYLTNNLTMNYNYEVARTNNIQGTYFYSKGMRWAASEAFLYAEGDEVAKDETRTYYASEALRIGIKELNIDVVNLEVPDERTNLASFIYDSSENADRGFGSPYGQLDLLKKRVDSLVQAPTDVPETIYALTQMQFNYEAQDNNSLCATFQKGQDDWYYAKVRLFIWLEGWDADCFDAILADTILMQLYFRCANKA